jgi:hypothetical protein
VRRAKRDVISELELDNAGRNPVKFNTMLNALLMTAMAMCMHMMCMRTAVGALEGSRIAR